MNIILVQSTPQKTPRHCTLGTTQKRLKPTARSKKTQFVCSSPEKMRRHLWVRLRQCSCCVVGCVRDGVGWYRQHHGRGGYWMEHNWSGSPSTPATPWSWYSSMIVPSRCLSSPSFRLIQDLGASTVALRASRQGLSAPLMAAGGWGVSHAHSSASTWVRGLVVLPKRCVMCFTFLAVGDVSGSSGWRAETAFCVLRSTIPHEGDDT